MNYRSHTREEIRDAIAKGAQVWTLDTGPDGEDDVLIGSREDVFQDICSFNDTNELPAHWRLIPFDERSLT
ncbi:MAG: hypothetical protein LJE70_02880 [Chromatiaceae bacterium]|jgi:hypothetical protein|nr:hypothetical protein [Chromatiaceae bacterium]